MNVTIMPGLLKGTVKAIPSKSQAHRLLICSAFADGVTTLGCPETNQDIEATVQCLNALGADITRTDAGYNICPVTAVPDTATLCCGESGSTLRFMLPIAGALGVDALFKLSGRLPNRPLSPLWEEMERMGCHLSRPTADTIRCEGKLRNGTYRIDGGVSSQFITGLLFALALMEGESKIEVLGKLESKPYVQMTQAALSAFGVSTDNYTVNDSNSFLTPGHIDVEGDWSNGAFFLAAKALGSDLTVTGLDDDSAQGDRAAKSILLALNHSVTVDAGDIPDLVPIFAVVAGANQGATFTNIARLRLKESDRVATVAAMLRNFGAQVDISENEMTVHPAPYQGCTVDAAGDHRIAMSAAIAATVADGPVTILGADCVAKSYPSFWTQYRTLGGKYEQYLR